MVESLQPNALMQRVIPLRMSALAPMALTLALLSRGSVWAGASTGCPSDLDDSGNVDSSDVGTILLSFGTANPATDLNFDGTVDSADVGKLLLDWGPCACSSTPITAIFNSATPLEPDAIQHTPSALVTHLADRARDRHAREDIVNGVIFRAYDHWLSWYWEQRIADIVIEDRVAKGGSGVSFTWTTQAPMNPAEFRTFYANTSSVALYINNQSSNPNMGVSLIASGPSVIHPGETDYTYQSVISRRSSDQALLRIGDRFEVEISQFLLAPRNGRSNYYGTAFLYVVGKGVVPWYAKAKEEATTQAARDAASFDSVPLPESAWTGGSGTLPYQYSNEPAERFKQMVGNITPISAQAFLLGRRLHHTNFADGSHSESGNPKLMAHAGQLGPKFVNNSCVACHVNNGRSVPPSVGTAITQSVVHVGADALGTPHPTLGEELQPLSTTAAVTTTIEAENYNAMNGIKTEVCADVGGGRNVGYIDAGDWMAYATQPLTVPTTANYTIEFRVASAVGGGRLVLEEAGGSVTYATLDIPNTGGWQTWVTLPVTVQVPAGNRSFAIAARLGGFNLNWFRITPISGVDASEGSVILSGWNETPGTYGDGTAYSLRSPTYRFTGTVPQFFSVRNAPPLVGLGLLEAIDESTLRALEDPCDADDDGISGRLATVNDPRSSGVVRAGRFTPKGGQARVRDQVAYALNRDMGVTSTTFATLDGETTARPAEVSDAELDSMYRYVALLGVASRRNLSNPTTLRGEQLFTSARCNACHTATLNTGISHPFAELRAQTIHPYTDLLLHDLGPGLADNMGNPSVSASEWRTSPLWSIGLTAGVRGSEAFLHDGRARTLEEAILWHAGEAQASKDNFRSMSAADRTALVEFLKSI